MAPYVRARLRSRIDARCGATTAADAGAYPNKPVRIICRAAGGGNADLVAAYVRPAALDRFGVQFVVDNRGGGGGVIGTELAVRALPRRLHTADCTDGARN